MYDLGSLIPASGLGLMAIGTALTGDSRDGCFMAAALALFVTWALVAILWSNGSGPALRRGAESEVAYGQRVRRVGGCVGLAGLVSLFYLCCLSGSILMLVGPGGPQGAEGPWVFIGGPLLLVAAALAVLVRPELQRRKIRPAAPAGGKPWHAKFLAWPNARIEVDPRGPGRTRLRIGAPGPLPMAGNARLRPPRGGRLGLDTLKRMRWVGAGAEEAKRWTEYLTPGLNMAVRVADEFRISVTLSPQGLLVQLPGLVPNDQAFAQLREAVGLLTDALETAANEPPPEGITFTTAAELTGACACCWEEMGPDDATTKCDVCGAQQHADCFEWTGGCGRFACTGA